MSRKVFDEMVTYIKDMVIKHQDIFKQIEEEKSTNQTRLNDLLKQGTPRDLDLDLIKTLETKALQAKTKPALKTMIDNLIKELK